MSVVPKTVLISVDDPPTNTVVEPDNNPLERHETKINVSTPDNHTEAKQEGQEEQEQEQEEQEQEQEEEQEEEDEYARLPPAAFRYRDVDLMLKDSFNYKESNHSTICDIIGMYLKGQKILYTEAKTLCEQRLNYLMLPTICITAFALSWV